MPPSFIKRISRSSSGFVTAGPNHHQRIMILALSGGCSNPLWRSLTLSALACAQGSKDVRVKISAAARRLESRFEKIFIDVLCVKMLLENSLSDRASGEHTEFSNSF